MPYMGSGRSINHVSGGNFRRRPYEPGLVLRERRRG